MAPTPARSASRQGGGRSCYELSWTGDLLDSVHLVSDGHERRWQVVYDEEGRPIASSRTDDDVEPSVLIRREFDSAGRLLRCTQLPATDTALEEFTWSGDRLIEGVFRAADGSLTGRRTWDWTCP